MHVDIASFPMAVQAQFFPDPFDFHLYNQQNFTFDPSSSSYNSNSSMSLSSFQGFRPYHLEMERIELDCLLQSQAEGLKTALQKQTREHMGEILKKMEREAIYAVRQKEENLIQARNRSIELEYCIRKAQRESECWQIMAKEKEAMAMNLSKQLEQLRELNGDQCDDSESICCGSCHEEEEIREKRGKMVCKGCKSRASCLVFLPCKHLCCCKFCEAFFVCCPVCESLKEGSIEVSLF